MNLLHKIDVDDKESAYYCIKLADKTDVIESSKSMAMAYFEKCLPNIFRVHYRNLNSNQAIVTLKNSASYRLGNFFIKPFSKIKRIFANK